MSVYKKLKAMKLLLIDDDEWIRDSMTLLFESEGCSLTALETAEEAITAIQKDRYDLMIVDYKLPGMDGLMFLKQVQQIQPEAIKILMSAYIDEGLILKFSEINIRHLIKKPISSEMIESVLNLALNGN